MVYKPLKSHIYQKVNNTVGDFIQREHYGCLHKMERTLLAKYQEKEKEINKNSLAYIILAIYLCILGTIALSYPP